MAFILLLSSHVYIKFYIYIKGENHIVCYQLFCFILVLDFFIKKRVVSSHVYISLVCMCVCVGGGGGGGEGGRRVYMCDCYLLLL